MTRFLSGHETPTSAPLDALLDGSSLVEQRPWRRGRVDAATWRRAGVALREGKLTLLSLWAEAAWVHVALLDEAGADIGVLSLGCPEGRYPSLGALHPPALRLERAVRDLWGLDADGSPDTRPWLDHGRWGERATLATRTAGRAVASPPSPRAGVTPHDYAFLATQGEGVHQIPVGPVHAGIIEPGHFRFTANGEAVVRLEERLGYVHKGIEALFMGASLAGGARLAGHVSGDSTVAYATAFARAVESALGWSIPPRAAWLRGLMAELERIANHIGDVGAICNDAAFTILHANCAVLRERILRANEACFGHRLLMDRVIPGGVAVDLAPDGTRTLLDTVALVQTAFDELTDVYDNSPSMLERAFHTGILQPELARTFGSGGFIGRASFRAFDARRSFAYPPYDALEFEVPVMNSGDVNARLWIRIKEVRQSIGLVEQMVDGLPEGDVLAAAPHARGSGEGVALVEGFRGDVFAWVRIGEGYTIERCHMRDPSWFQWPLLEAAIEGNIVADFPLCNKSFNCSYSGHDL
jgi:Ni,Fe-hydrogenase III large subunit